MTKRSVRFFKIKKTRKSRAKKTIIPNVRQNNKKPKTSLKTGSLSPSKNTQVGFGAIEKILYIKFIKFLTT